MKKYIYTVLVAVFLVLTTACENDPISIRYGVPVKVDPSGVIAPFTYEINTGELESFSTSYKLRVRLFAYDSEGKLAAADSAFLTNYAGILNTSIPLSEGEYTLVAITDVVKYESNRTTLEHWYLSDTSDINLVKVTNAGFIGGKNKVLGIAIQRITVIGGEMNTVNMNPRPAGALLCIRFLHIHEYSDVTEYKLQTNRNSDYLTFDSQGNAVTTPQNNNNQFSWRVQYIEPNDYTDYANIYGWNFMFPVSNANYRFVYSTNTETDEVLVSDMIVNLSAGDEYLFMLDLADEDFNYGVSYYYGKVNGNGSFTRTSDMQTTPWMERRLIDAQYSTKLKDLME